MICLTDLTSDDLVALIAELGQPSYRAKQLQHWIYKELAASYGQMGNIPKILREKLARKARISRIKPVHESMAKDGTVKILFSLLDGRTIEASMMQHPAGKGKWRHTVCVSTQAGVP